LEDLVNIESGAARGESQRPLRLDARRRRGRGLPSRVLPLARPGRRLVEGRSDSHPQPADPIPFVGCPDCDE